MARIAGVDIPDKKRGEIALTYIFGIGRKSASDIIKATGVNPDTRVRELTDDEVNRLREIVDKEMRVDCQTFARAVDRVSTISSERGRAVKLALADGQLMLTVNNPDSGSATEEVAVGYENDAMEIGFNAKYLLDITSQLSGDDAIFLLADAGSPTLIRDTAGVDALYVLMPMRV